MSFQALPGEAFHLYSPRGLRLVDEYTAGAPVGPVDVELDVEDGAGWRPSGFEALITASQVVVFAGLGLALDVNRPPVRYRARLLCRFYRPAYRLTDDGIELDAPPYDHDNPPQPITLAPELTHLLPSTAYPFPSHVPVLRGVVEDANGDPVADVLVQEGMRERVLSDERGAFSLPLRWVAEGVPTVIGADDQRNGRQGQINVTLPAALTSNQTITVIP
jgi:hypothetical protein